jgi:CRISPR-associated protein Cas5d
MSSQTVAVKVWGEYALFTRPELKVERVSYPIMTPSAARGVLDAILYKPQMRWHIRRITALRPPTLSTGAMKRDDRHYRLVSFRRNEIDGKINPDEVVRWAAGTKPAMPHLTDSERVQRNSLVLQHVAYRIDASPLLTSRANMPRTSPEDEDDRGPDTEVKYAAMFERRVAKGQCFHRPYLGIREFAAHFGPVDPSESPLPWNDSFGFMLYDVQFREIRPREFVPDRPGFFDAHMQDGVMHCDTQSEGPAGQSPVIVHW